MRNRAAAALIFLLCVALWTGGVAAPETDSAFLARVDQQFENFGRGGDGQPLIRWVHGIDIERRHPYEHSKGLVLVIVEPRLLTGVSADADPVATPLLTALSTYADDLCAEGWEVRTVAMQVYDGTRHQDGRILLAMRRYLQTVRAEAPSLAGVVIVGSFPEGFLVRKYNWRQCQPTVINDGKPNREDFGGKDVVRLRSRAENVGGRFDLPLADLDGHWERIYHEASEDLECIMAVYPDLKLPKGKVADDEWFNGGRTRHFEIGSDHFEDFFYVNDGQYEIRRLPHDVIDLKLRDDLDDAEVGAADRKRPNPICVPQLLVSRIDTRHIALRPQAKVRGTHGEGLLDARGLPQTVTFADAKSTPRGLDIWEWDPALEQRLLLEFFERDHRFRHGAFRRDLKPASVQFGLWSFMDQFHGALAQWKDYNAPGCDLQGDDATICGIAQWLQRPAILRGVSAHSDPWGSAFKGIEAKDVPALERACGGQPWNWIKRGNQLVPTLGPTGKLDFAIERTLWANNILPDSANLFLHSGCEITTPEGMNSLPYNHPQYAHWQGAEALLYYCKGVALVGRSKGFYDFPPEFAKTLGQGKTFGDAWRRYFEAESSEKDILKVGGGIGRKRSYWWNLLGDWTVTLTGAGGGR